MGDSTMSVVHECHAGGGGHAGWAIMTPEGRPMGNSVTGDSVVVVGWACRTGGWGGHGVVMPSMLWSSRAARLLHQGSPCTMAYW